MYETQPENSTSNTTYNACLCFKINFWVQMFIGEINVFEVSGVDSSKRHYNSVIHILSFTLKFQNTTQYYYLIQKLFFHPMCACVEF